MQQAHRAISSLFRREARDLGLTEVSRKDMPTPRKSGIEPGRIACRLLSWYIQYDTEPVESQLRSEPANAMSRRLEYFYISGIIET